MERIAQALEDMRELRSGPPRGHLRIGSTPGFGRKIVAPLLRGFHAQYPEIALELLLNDRPADFTADRVDVSFRDGRMEDSGIVARQLDSDADDRLRIARLCTDSRIAAPCRRTRRSSLHQLPDRVRPR